MTRKTADSLLASRFTRGLTVACKPGVLQKRLVTWRVGLVWGCALLASLLGGATASALDIVDVRWGFNGKVAPNRFNLLSVQVQNPTPQPWDGEITAKKSLGGAGTVDAPVVERVTLAPFSQPTWVRFYVYITGDGWGNSTSNENWKLSWKGGSFDQVPVPRIAKYQRVVLTDTSGMLRKGGALKQMPEELFPAFVTATDALQVVAIDHEPRQWSPGQKDALLDWLHLGGTVMLVHGINGKFPEFTGPLSVLNSPLDEGRHGAGRVMRIPRAASTIDADEARQMLAGLPKNHVGPNEKPEDPIDMLDPTLSTQPSNANLYGEGADPFHSSSFLGQLKQMTKPDHNWVLLHFMFWVYIAMIFPGCYLLGKKYTDFRVVYAGLLGTVLLFSILFSIVGQRGYGESTAVHSVAIARPLPDGSMDVSAWSNVFVTGGARYDVRHNGKGVLYSTCNQAESVNGTIVNGAEALFNVDIPPFSNREFAHRIKLPGPGPKLTIESLKLEEGRLTQLILKVDGLKPEDVEPTQYLLFGNRFYSLAWRDGGLTLVSDAGDATALLQLQQSQQWANNYSYGYDPYNQRNIQTAKERYSLMFRPLLSRSLNVGREREAQQVQLPPDIVRVYLYGKMPPEFTVQNAKLGKQEGEVLYCIDVPLRETPAM